MAYASKKKKVTPAPVEARLRVHPHSVEAEWGLLGSILLDAPRVMNLCSSSGLVPEAFYEPAHRILYEAVVAMVSVGVAVDAVTLIDRLTTGGLLEKVGGTKFIEHLVDSTPSAGHSEYYLDIVRQKYILRKVLAAASETETSCYTTTDAADLVLSEAEQRFLKISEESKVGSILTWQGAIGNSMQHFELLFKLGKGAVAGLSTGFRNLDHKLNGLRPAEMIVLAARPSQGKTSLAMNIAECVALGRDMNGRPMVGNNGRKHPVAIFSVEMSQESLAQRMLCGVAQVSGFVIETGCLNKESVNTALTRAASTLMQAPIYVDDTGGIGVMEVRSRARRLLSKHKIELIIIDYLQIMTHKESAGQGKTNETTNISNNVKAMAKELNVPVIILSQLSRSPEQRDKSARPKCSDLRDSGAIEQDADVIMLLRRPCTYPGDSEYEDKTLAIVDVAKHRNGPTGEVRLNFNGELTRFSDRDEMNSEEGSFVPVES